MARIPSSSRFSDPFAPEYSISARASHSGCTVAPYIWDHEATLVLSGGYEFSGVVPKKGLATVLRF